METNHRTQTTDQYVPVRFDLTLFFFSVQVNKAHDDVRRYFQLKCDCQKEKKNKIQQKPTDTFIYNLITGMSD